MFKKTPLKKILILVAILALPGFLYYLLQAKGKNRYKPLPIYGPKEVLKTYHKKRGKIIPDTLYHQVNKFEALDQDGNKFILNKKDNQLLLIHFFYTQNKNLNNEVKKNILPIYKEFLNNKLIKFVWISVDNKFDKPDILRNYADSLGIQNKHNWVFLTSVNTDVFNMAKSEYFLNAVKLENNEIIISEKIVLLDTQHRIRGYYDATNSASMQLMSDELKVQITEELRKIKAEL